MHFAQARLFRPRSARVCAPVQLHNHAIHTVEIDAGIVIVDKIIGKLIGRMQEYERISVIIVEHQASLRQYLSRFLNFHPQRHAKYAIVPSSQTNILNSILAAEYS